MSLSDRAGVPGPSPFMCCTGDFSGPLDKVEEFLTGEPHKHTADRTLATVLFTDIVGSTKQGG